LSAALVLSWCDGVSVESEAGADLAVRGPRSRVVLRRLASVLAQSLHQLRPPGAVEDDLVERIRADGGSEVLPSWYYTLQRLAERGLVCRSVRADGRSLATLLPLTATAPFPTYEIVARQPVRLSRFAYLHREGDVLVLESPLAHARVRFDDSRSAALLGALAQPATAAELAERVRELAAEAVPLLLGLLAGAGMLDVMGPGDTWEEPAALRSWEFHDLLFHTRSRKGRTDAPFGATYRMAGLLDPPPATKSPAAVETWPLFQPDLEKLRRDDPPLTQVVEQRRSLRQYGSEPITAEQLGEVLYRVARTKGPPRQMTLATIAGDVRMDFLARPYPSGGALYELEFYLAIQSCAGLPPGLYHFDGTKHQLARLSDKTTEVTHLLADAAASAGIPAESVQVVLILSARFARVAWKYASIAYALILKEVGVVFHALYLAATALGLAPCALGSGDSDLFARAAGTDYCAESSVGEFLLGSRAPTEE
jgi:SagB-type dehydrogenase family enzyme